MNVVLLNPPNHRHDTHDLAPPLGLLVLAEVLMQIGCEVHLLDLNLALQQAEGPSEYFYDQTEKQIIDLAPDVVCFTSMGINSHVAIEVARRLKRKRSGVKTVFGGPHFSSIADELCVNFPWVDFVLVGDGEELVISLVGRLRSKTTIPSKVLRSLASDQTSNRRLGHPWSAYKLLSLKKYFELNDRHVLNLETGRGCKYRCAFCYSPGHWHRATHLEPAGAVRDFETASLTGAKHVFLVQDNFLNDITLASAFCLRLAEHRLPLTWNCYATLPDIRENVPAMLAEAGCDSVYLGIDIASDAQRRSIGKAFAESQETCLQKIISLVHVGICPTCSFIVDPFLWSDDEIERTLRFALRLRLTGAEISLHILDRYNNTALAARSVGHNGIPDDFRIRLMFDCPEVVFNNAFAAAHPKLFPFHVRPNCSANENIAAVLMIHVAQNLISCYPNEINDLVSSGETDVIALLRSASRHFGSSGLNSLSFKSDCRSFFQQFLETNYAFSLIS